MSGLEEQRQGKLYTDLSNIVIWLSKSRNGFSMPSFRRWRVADSVAAVAGVILTVIFTFVTFGTGYGRYVLVWGLILTAVSVWLLSKLPKVGPGPMTRLRWLVEARSPRTTCTHAPAVLAGRRFDPHTGRMTAPAARHR